MKRISLRSLILFIALLSVVLTLASSMYSGYRIDQKTSMEKTLEMNRIYAQKLASTTDLYVNMMVQSLEEVAKDLPSAMGEEVDQEILLHETDRLFNQSNSFNSVVITDAEGKVLATSPESIGIIGDKLDSDGGQEALTKREAFISRPYLSITDRLIIMISQPIFDEAGEYLGLIGGTIYLQEDNILQDLLEEHYYKDSSYVFVVDCEGDLIYHHEKDRILDDVKENAVVQDLSNGKSGAKQLINTQGIEMLAGYATIPSLNWGIVSQRPLDEVLAPSKTLVKEMIIFSLPLLIISICIIIFITRYIAEPLEKLARFTKKSVVDNENNQVEFVRAWYYEAIQLKEALIHSLDFLHSRVNHFLHQSATDPLTLLMNRRGLDETLEKWQVSGIPFSIILIDIDKFKLVNDTYGHAVGDEVLKYLAYEMNAVIREDDIACRFGGEEFIILLRNTDTNAAFIVAERLRKNVESTPSPTGEPITISSGVATYPKHTTDVNELIEKADTCLYEAKNTGRNKTIAYKENAQ